MGKRELGPYPGLLYAHLTDVQHGGSVKVHTFAVHPLPIARPAKGRTAETLMCGTCRQRLRYTVLSLAGTRARRAAWLTVAIVGLVAAVVFGFQTFALGGDVLEEGRENPLDLFVPLFLGGAVAAVTGLSRWWHEDGVRGPGRLLGMGTHSLRWPRS
ncbi:hypothetical protein GCM10018781_19090 [Kitasatospora indigofera]|uniref:Uncharacterized protein n=1 Tax=Kitasatospora indigofera TaxID=67307 RepID=A0A919FJ09_9ACTN|nr:hypothetical protein [Kitasatospora indigofera]GHH65983.1 hypothetical protein GCM10018781_19090 [Kitasatospora indigofera]